MKAVVILLIAILSLFVNSLSAQSIFKFEYSFHQSNDSTLYQAMFIRNEDGSGFARIRYMAPGSAELTLVELNMQEDAQVNDDAQADPGEVFYYATDTVFIIGNPGTSLTAPVFWFAGSQGSEIYDPVAYSATTGRQAIRKMPFQKAELLKQSTLQRNLVLQFFTKEEEFYKNIFEPRSRGLSPAEKNIKIHLLVVANTNDSIIGKACGMSMTMMTGTLRRMASLVGIGFQADSIYGKLYNKANVQKAIDKLKPGSNDIVIVYYMGHGFRKPKDPRPYPYIDLMSDPKKYDYMIQSLNIEDIFNDVRRKKARLTLVLSDCCNTDPNETNIVARPVPKPRDSELPMSIENFKKLFLDPARISILATAADAGQKATSNNNFGGFFSYYFKASLNNYLGPAKKFITWDVLIADAKMQTVYKAEHTYCDKPFIRENICRQYPIYKKVYEQD
jgi:hypothetical protein